MRTIGTMLGKATEPTDEYERDPLTITVRMEQPLTPRMKLLLVDDEQEICLLLNAMLNRYGAETTMAHSVQQAEVKLKDGPYDGIFLDVNLPDGKGYDLIPAIRANDPDTRVLVISAMDQERDHALLAGADLFISKPLDRRAILDSMRKVGLLDPEKEPN